MIRVGQRTHTPTRQVRGARRLSDGEKTLANAPKATWTARSPEAYQVDGQGAASAAPRGYPQVEPVCSQLLRLPARLLAGLMAGILLMPQPCLATDDSLGVHPRADATVVRPGQPPFENAPHFKIMAKKKDTDLHPCWDCHYWTEPDRNARTLEWVHDDFRLQHGLHGKGEFWCFTCHHLEGDGGLRTLEGDKVSFDDAYVVCAQCHTRQTRDWAFGAHGKRMGGWRGERVVLNCTVCHDEHRPVSTPRSPQPPPPMRRGLEREPIRPTPPISVWQRRPAAPGDVR